MIQISDADIKGLSISPETCVEWIGESFKIKYESQLPAKISVHPKSIDFFTTMPALLPISYNRFGVKVVSRINGRVPSLKSDIFLYNANGTLLAIIDGQWITAMRTGAAATLAIKTLQKSEAKTYGIMGLGEIGKATMQCLLSQIDTTQAVIKVLRYKNSAEEFIANFKNSGVTFELVNTVEELVQSSDVLISAITQATDLICDKDNLYPKGILLVPIHTRGFQNCDLFFDKVIGDDYDHIKGFNYFSRFKSFEELSAVLLNRVAGRENDNERILSYNIGLGLHDIYFANKIYEELK